MTTPEPSDEELFAMLKQAVAPVGGAPTEHELQLARPARDLVATTGRWDIAELEFDSLVDAASAMRGAVPEGGRELTFHTPDATLRVEVTADLLTCRLEPTDHAVPRLATPQGAHHELSAVGGGVYELLDPPSGMVRFEVESTGMHFATSWVRLYPTT
jgi:hypothetical protein